MSNSTPQGKVEKPDKPNSTYPLFAHSNGLWCKKIRGKHVYFGRWDDPAAALQRYLDQKDDLHAGRTPREAIDGLTIRDLANRFLTAKTQQAKVGEVTPRTAQSYFSTCRRIVEAFGKHRPVVSLTASDFTQLRDVMAETLGPATRKLEIARTKAVFHYGYDMDLIDRPVKFGPDFKAPTTRMLKKARRQNGGKTFSAEEVRAMLDAALPHIRAMVLLGINCGFGNNDVATLPFSALDLERGWVEHPRPKTGVDRRCPLWQETIDALKEVIANRPKSKDIADADLVFITSQGNRWVRLKQKGSDISKACWTDSLTLTIKVLLQDLGIKRPGRNFYGLRHTFETIAGESLDQVAVDHIMGHADSSMAAVYRERIGDDRLRAVVKHVHGWLFGSEENE